MALNKAGRCVRLALALGTMAILAGCSVQVEMPEDVKDRVTLGYPRRAVTDFSSALTCMYRMLVDAGAETIYLAAAQIPDLSEAPGQAGTAAYDLLLGAITAMSASSDAIRFVAFSSDTPDIAALQGVHPDNGKFHHPDFFIRGALSQIDANMWAGQKGVNFSLGDQISALSGTSVGKSATRGVTTITLDLHVGMVPTFQMLPGISSSNSLTVLKDSYTAELDLAIEGNGLVWSLSENRGQSLSGALRALIEVGAIELVGRLFSLPYWECLGVAGPSSEDEMLARAAWDGMNDDGRSSFVLEQLHRLQFLDEVPDPGAPLPNSARQALARFRFEHGLSPVAVIDFAVFRPLFLQSKVNREVQARKPSPPPARRADRQ